MTATRREWVGLAVLGLPTLLISIDVSVLYLALPEISQALDATAIEQLWILDIYSFLLAGFLITMGNVGDRIGRRRLLLIGAAAFAVASTFAAFATSPEQLIAARAILGIAGATIAPSTMALIRNMFPDPREMTTAIGIWFACFMGGILVGPIVGGVLLQNFWWGSVFLLGVPVMLVLLITAPVLLPEYRAPQSGRIDIVSVALSLATVLPVVWGVKELARAGGSAAIPALAIAVGVTAGAVFVRRQRRLSSPLLDLRIFRSRIFTGSLLIVLLAGVVMAGLSLVAAVYLQSVLDYDPLTAGLWLVPQSVAMLAGFQIAPAIARRMSITSVAAIGLAVAGSGFAVITAIPVLPTPGGLVAGLCLASFGVAFPMALLSSLMLGAVDPEKAGAAAAVNETSGELGVAMGIAVVGSLATWVYSLTLAGLEPQAPTVALASLTGALSLGDAGLAAAAREAFTASLSAIGILGAATFSTMAIVAVRVLGTSRATPRVDAGERR
jgi:DHA2 family multidrug resistance protein-like MFS transporter